MQQIDFIIKLAEILGAASAILAAIIGAYKLYDKLIDELADLKKQVAALEADNDRIKKEDTLV